MHRVKILVLGDEKNAPFHPLSRIKNGIESALSDIGEIEFCTNYKEKNISQLMEYPIIISYLDNYKELNGFDDILSEYVIKGGKILALHNGIITPENSKLEQIYGGKFTTHPAYCLLNYQVSDEENWITEKAFSLGEEPYMIESADEQRRIFLWYSYHGRKYEAGWYKKAGEGEILYLALGHDERTAANSYFQSLLKECVMRWGRC